MEDDKNKNNDVGETSSGFSSSHVASANMSVARPWEYNMQHSKRGKAIIFNHEHFKPYLKLEPRTGTNVDCENLKRTLERLAFEVDVHKDKRFIEIMHIVEELANVDHTEHDCLLISILSHGGKDIIFANDSSYELEKMWYYFTASSCPTLAGKPKLFFMQACQEHRLEPAYELCHTDSDRFTDRSMTYRIPIHADFLIAYSTIPGHYSWQNTSRGSWFIQCLCQQLDRDGYKYDILTLLTMVCRRVATEYESNTPDHPEMRRKKQITCTTSMLTGSLLFKEKPAVRRSDTDEKNRS